MTVDRINPCVCSIDDYEEGHIEDSDYGMSVRGATTAKERQLYYWRKEMESTHRRRNVYPKDSENWKEWNNRYESAVRTWNELTGMKLEAMK